MFRIPFDRVNWITSSFLIGTALIALIGAPIYLYHFGIDWFQFGMFFFYLCATMMSITVGYHRLFSHISFKAKTPVKLFTLLFGACAFENSCLNWSSDHRRHHKHVDHDEDPYDISKGFFWAHIGWLLFKLNPEPPIDNVADLRKDKLVMWHTVGKQPYSTKHSARDSALMAFLTFGEGYHNYHHEFQHDYRNGVKPWQWDPTKWTIWTLSKIGLVEGLRRVPDSKILLAEMGEARRVVEERLSQIQAAPDYSQRTAEALTQLYEKICENYRELEQALADRVDLSRKALQNWQDETRALMRQFLHLARPAMG